MADHDDIVRRIVGLLAKAEGTDIEEERDAFLAGAARLMAKYQIDQATIDGATRPEEMPEMETFVYATDGRFIDGKRMLLTLACEMAGGGTTGGFIDSPADGDGQEWAAIIGYPVERTVARLTYVSLLKMVLSEVAKREYTQERIVNSFMIGFARGVHDKIARARRMEEYQARRRAEGGTPGDPFGLSDTAVVARAALVLLDERAAKVREVMPDREEARIDVDELHPGVFNHGYMVGEMAPLDLGIHKRLDEGED